jgi:hypothetical protein
MLDNELGDRCNCPDSSDLKGVGTREGGLWGLRCPGEANERGLYGRRPEGNGSAHLEGKGPDYRAGDALRTSGCPWAGDEDTRR